MCLFLDKCTIISMKPRSFVVLSAHRALHISLGLAHENEAGGSWGQEINILHVNI